MKVKDPLKYNNYFSYLYATAKNTTAAQKLKGIYSFLRKYILAGRLFRYARLIFLWVQTGTCFILFASALMFVIPLILFSLIVFSSYTVRMHKRYNRYFFEKLKGNTVCIIFRETENYVEKECCSDGIMIYVIQNPFTGLTEGAKKLGRNTYLVSMSYFFSLKKYVLKNSVRTQIIYNTQEV